MIFNFFSHISATKMIFWALARAGLVLELPKSLAVTRKKNSMVYDQNYHNCSTLGRPVTVLTNAARQRLLLSSQRPATPSIVPNAILGPAYPTSGSDVIVGKPMPGLQMNHPQKMLLDTNQHLQSGVPINNQQHQQQQGLQPQIMVIGPNCYYLANNMVKLIGPAHNCHQMLNHPQQHPQQHPSTKTRETPPETKSSIWATLESLPLLGQLLKDSGN
jgi:hypothetical protein